MEFLFHNRNANSPFFLFDVPVLLTLPIVRDFSGEPLIVENPSLGLAGMQAE